MNPSGPRPGLGGMSGAGLLVTATVCLALLISLSTLCWLSIDAQEIPQQLETICTGLILAATGLLAKTWADRPASDQDGGEAPAEVIVANEPDEPVPFVEAPRSRRKRISLQDKPRALQDVDTLPPRDTLA